MWTAVSTATMAPVASSTPSNALVDPVEENVEPSLEEAKCEEEEEVVLKELDVTINNVVCSFSVGCHVNLEDLSTRGLNVEYRRENNMVTMKLRRPYTTASIWSSGKITCTGATSEDEAKVAARRFARRIQRLGFKAKFKRFRVVNVLGTCSLPFGVKIADFSQEHKPLASYEPELHPAVTYKDKLHRATLKIFQTGSITVTAPRVLAVQEAIEAIYDKVELFKKPKPKREEVTNATNGSNNNNINAMNGKANSNRRGGSRKRKRRGSSIDDDVLMNDEQTWGDGGEDDDDEDKDKTDKGNGQH